MNFNTLKQALYEKIKMMSEEDFNNFLSELKRVYYKAHKNAKYEDFMALHFTECEQESCTLDDAREDFVFDVYNILDFLPTNNEANQIIDVFDRVTSRLGQEKRTGYWVKYSVPRCGEQHYKCGEHANRWIPVSERLPEEEETVIASTEYRIYPETRYTKEYGWEWAYEAGADYWESLEGVMAWMPLPKPYEAESE